MFRLQRMPSRADNPHVSWIERGRRSGQVVVRECLWRHIPAAIAASVSAVLALAGCGLGNSVSIRVRNDRPVTLRIASCVDDAQDVAPGGQFDAEGVPHHGKIACLVTIAHGPERCLAIRVPTSGMKASRVSRGDVTPASRCD
jgi:hypothetical protein